MASVKTQSELVGNELPQGFPSPTATLFQQPVVDTVVDYTETTTKKKLTNNTIVLLQKHIFMLDHPLKNVLVICPGNSPHS